ncbi:hypothetical protein OPV22_017793 [Ensete ventricosum]|uniref:Uncharacterized protein n=1 Tax=Ensete ventricosum TaxID=4639 RepID=A0AAV8QY19_ENSVE|nr:hypothetical protein OPV22_017793 [Ensete ventricosum]
MAPNVACVDAWMEAGEFLASLPSLYSSCVRFELYVMEYSEGTSINGFICLVSKGLEMHVASHNPDNAPADRAHPIGVQLVPLKWSYAHFGFHLSGDDTLSPYYIKDFL